MIIFKKKRCECVDHFFLYFVFIVFTFFHTHHSHAKKKKKHKKDSRLESQVLNKNILPGGISRMKNRNSPLTFMQWLTPLFFAASWTTWGMKFLIFKTVTYLINSSSSYYSYCVSKSHQLCVCIFVSLHLKNSEKYENATTTKPTAPNNIDIRDDYL